MTMDGVPPEHIEAFLQTCNKAFNISTETPSYLLHQKYDSLRKILSESALRQKMRKDSITVEDIDKYFAISKANDEILSSPPRISPVPHSPAVTPPAIRVDLKKYKQLRSILPDNALRQKMVMDNIPEEEINLFLSEVPSSHLLNTKQSTVIPFPKLRMCKGKSKRSTVTGMSQYPKYDVIKSEMVKLVSNMMRLDNLTEDDIIRTLGSA